MQPFIRDKESWLNILLASTSVIIGLLLLTWAADRFVAGASAIAYRAGVSPLLVGLTIVALGTSAPEVFVAATASWHHNAGLAIGNALGSNIANIGLVLGVTALLCPLRVSSRTLRREYPVLFLIMLLTWLMLRDDWFSRMDGLMLVVGLIAFVVWIIHQGIKEHNHSDPLAAEYKAAIPSRLSLGMASMWFIIGLVLLPLSANLLVSGAVIIAKALGISELIIGLTIVAIGTSLPEVATSVISALKSEPDLAIGNIIGSNIFNLLAVLPFPGLLAPGRIEHHVLSRDIPAMFAFTVILFLVAYGRNNTGTIRRREGVLLLTCYAAYLGLLILTG